MSDNAEFIYNSAFCQRVKSLREQRGWTQAQMATALGVPHERYKKYENRSPLPHYLLERFALIVGQDLHFVVTGHADPARVASLLDRNSQRRA